MIRLIATDMDGCLLTEKGELPPDFGTAYDLMRRNDVIFAAVSGRSMKGVKRPFGDYAEDILFISDNGARASYIGEMLFSRTLDLKTYTPVIQEMRKHKDLLPVACGENYAWVEDKSKITPEMAEELSKYYLGWNECSFDEIPEKVIKFAMLYFDDIEKNIYPYFEKYDNDRICVQVTAYVWIDIYEKGVSKGEGLKAVQDRFNISPDETMVFGDYLNDISMADYAAASFAPANAHQAVKERFTGVIASNTEYGVTGKIISMLGS